MLTIGASDHGLRVSEVVVLNIKNLDLKAVRLTVYRPKVDKVQTHELTIASEPVFFRLNGNLVRGLLRRWNEIDFLNMPSPG